MLEELIERHGFEPRGNRHHALVTFGAGFAVESGHRDDLHRHPLTLGLELDGVEGLAGVLCVRDVDLLNLSTTSLQELQHGVPTLDLFATNRTIAATLLEAMKVWLGQGPRGVDASELTDLQQWVQERSQIAIQTTALTRAGAAASWR